MKKLAAKAGLIQLPPLAPAQPAEKATEKPPEEARPKTAPGSMLHFMASQSSAIQEAETLREQLKEFDGAMPVRRLDAGSVRPSKWANRHELAFDTPEFQELKADIQAAGGNVQPIKVRPVLNGSTPPEQSFEIVYGHRRHRACLELGLPVLALVEPASDQELFIAMDRENRGRANLSAWEQGVMYRRALDEGLYPSMRKLAEAVGVDLALVSKSVTLARLPDTVIQAFANPTEIQFRWGPAIAEKLQKDPDGLLARAGRLRKLDPRPAAAEVFDQLMGKPKDAAPAVEEITVAGKRLATVEQDRKGRVAVRFDAGAIPENRRKELVRLVRQFLSA